MSDNKPYNESDPSSIEEYAKKLLDKSLHEVINSQKSQTYKGKGKLGLLLEDIYFHYKPNNKQEPDFPKAGVELKTSPLKRIRKGLVAKERLVLNMIDYFAEYKKTFENSSFLKKNKMLLLMFYLYEAEKKDIDYIFKIVRLWIFPDTDLKIIRDDWEKIVQKIREGKAHEISGGDTLYLEACTKGSTHDKSLRDQPYSKEKASARAFALKQRYLNFIVEKSLKDEKIEIKEEKIKEVLDDAARQYEMFTWDRHDIFDLDEIEPVVKSISEYRKGETFEQNVIKRFEKYYGGSESELCKILSVSNNNAKGKFYLIAKAIMGVKKKHIEEFEKAEVEMKTIRLECSGSIKESMSFAQIKYKEIVNEEWEDSYWYHTLSKRFFFVVFKKDENEVFRLKKAMFWTMPVEDLKISKEFWEDTKQKIINGIFNEFIKISDNQICHVRPKGADGEDKMKSARGTWENKKCYWLNSRYIKSIIQET